MNFDKLTVAQLLENYPALCGIRMTRRGSQVPDAVTFHGMMEDYLFSAAATLHICSYSPHLDTLEKVSYLNY